MFTDFELPIFKLYSMWDKRLEHFNLESVLYVTQVFKSSLMVQMSIILDRQIWPKADLGECFDHWSLCITFDLLSYIDEMLSDGFLLP